MSDIDLGHRIRGSLSATHLGALVFALLIWLFITPVTANAAMHATQAEAYQACMVFAKLNYEARTGPKTDAQKYKCVRPDNPNSSNSYTGAIWLKSCETCQYFWSIGYGREEWPLVSVSPPLNMGPTCEGPDRCGTDAGNPINVGARNKYEVASDIERRGLLEFVRYYNSLPDVNAVQPLGSGWSHSYLSRLETSASDIPGRSAKLYRPTGGYSLFIFQSDGEWLADSGTAHQLSELRDGGGVTLGWEYRSAARDRVERYDAKGRLIRVGIRSGDWIDLAYNNGSDSGTISDFLVTSVTARDRRSIQFSYDSDGRLVSVTAPDGFSYGYSYDSSGMLSTVTWPGGSSRAYLYNEQAFTASADLPAALTGVIDEMGQRFATWRYDTAGRPVESEHAGGVESYRATYNSTSSLVQVRGPLGAVQNRDFTSKWGVSTLGTASDQCTGCPAGYVGYSYDLAGKLDTVRDRRGNVTDHNRNAWGGEVQRIDAVGTTEQRTTQTDFEPDLRVPLERRFYNASGTLILRTQWTHNQRGQILTETRTDPATSKARTTTATYCEQNDVEAGTCPLVGLLRSVDGARTDATDDTEYFYYGADHPDCVTSPSTCAWRKGDLWKVINASGQVTETLRYDGAGRARSIKDANGVVTDLDYDARGRLIGRTTRASN